MTVEQKMVRRVTEWIQDRPEVATPDHNFVHSWAFGNAGLENEKITEEQVDSVLLREKSA